MRSTTARTAALLLVVLAATACSDADRAKLAAAGEPHVVVVISGNVVTGRWVSTGKIESESNSDGWAFKDRKSNALVRTSGTATLYPLPSELAADSVVRAWGADYGDLSDPLLPPAPAVPRDTAAAPGDARR